MAKLNRVWSNFCSKTVDGNVLRFRIEEVSPDRIEDVIDLCINYFTTEETFNKTAGIPKNVEAMRESREVLKKLLDHRPHHIVVCCLEDNTQNEYIGASLMILTKDDSFEEIKPRTPEMKKFFEIIGGVMSKYDPLKELQLNCFYDDRGVVVHPKYRGLGIAQEFFKVRRMICKEHGVPLTAAWMTSAGSQKAAGRDGWETALEISYEELGNQFGVKFESVPPTCKFMTAKID